MTTHRDRAVLKSIAGLLEATKQFSLVTTTGIPERDGQSAEQLKLATLELESWTEDKFADEPTRSYSYTRMVTYTLVIYSRDYDPMLRDDECDRLGIVALNALDGVSYGSDTVPALSGLFAGRYLPATGIERQLVMRGQFAQIIDGISERDGN